MFDDVRARLYSNGPGTVSYSLRLCAPFQETADVGVRLLMVDRTTTLDVGEGVLQFEQISGTLGLVLQ